MAAIDRYINTITERARSEAHEDGSAAVEAHHLLLAIAADGAGDPAEDLAGAAACVGHPAEDLAGAAGVGDPAEILAGAGLDRQAVREALDREFEHSLSAAGVSLAAFGLPRPRATGKPPTQLAASAKLALERGFASAGRKKDLRPAHLPLGILRAEVGTVPRALALAGVDRAELVARLLRAT